MSMTLFQTALLLPAEAMLNQVLALDERSRDRLGALDGRTLALELREPRMTLYICIRNGRIALAPVSEGFDERSDARLSGRAADLLRMLLQREPVGTLAPFNVELRGSTTLVRQLQNLLRELDIDWEYHLSRVLGDLPTVALGKGLREGRRFVGDGAKAFGDNLGEYLAHETGLLPSRVEAERFYADIAALDLRLDRLSARIDRL